MLRKGLLVLLCIGLCVMATGENEDNWAEQDDLTGEAEIALQRIEEKHVQLIQSEDTPTKDEHKMCAILAKTVKAKPKAKFTKRAPVKKFSLKKVDASKGRKLLGSTTKKADPNKSTTDTKAEDEKTPTKDKQDLVNKAKEAFEKFKEKAAAAKGGKKDTTKGGKKESSGAKPDEKDAAKLVLATVRMASDEAAQKKAFKCCVIKSKCRAAMNPEAGKAVMDTAADKLAAVEAWTSDSGSRRLMGSTGKNIVPTDKGDKTPAPAPANPAKESDFEIPFKKPDLEALANKIKALMAKVNECVANTDKTCV